jgi:hypothetical protein
MSSLDEVPNSPANSRRKRLAIRWPPSTSTGFLASDSLDGAIPGVGPRKDRQDGGAYPPAGATAPGQVESMDGRRLIDVLISWRGEEIPHTPRQPRALATPGELAMRCTVGRKGHGAGPAKALAAGSEFNRRGVVTALSCVYIRPSLGNAIATARWGPQGPCFLWSTSVVSALQSTR